MTVPGSVILKFKKRSKLIGFGIVVGVAVVGFIVSIPLYYSYGTHQLVGEAADSESLLDVTSVTDRESSVEESIQGMLRKNLEGASLKGSPMVIL